MTPIAKGREFWQCPACRNRYWLFCTPVEKLICPQATCLNRCVPISYQTYLKPDNAATTATAYICVDPEELKRTVAEHPAP